MSKETIKPANTFIDEHVTLRAQRLSGAESVRIDGCFIGDIELDGYLQIGDTGRVEGNLQVAYALISGQVHGNIMCRATIHLSPNAKVYGDISTDKIIMDEGASFYGLCKTRGSSSEVVVI